MIEVRSLKPGNVSPAAAFDDASVLDFEHSANIIAPILADTNGPSVGPTILAAVSATVAAVGHNTNLGIVLLLAPLARVPAEHDLPHGIGAMLQALSIDDSIAVYEAIRIASPGGLGQAADQDVNAPPSINLLECMQLAADRDQIAAQYANGYRDVLDTGLKLLLSTARWTTHTELRLAWLAVSLMATFGDSLIHRKCGEQLATEVRQRAQDLLSAGWPFDADTVEQYANFDQFLRANGHQRNPGATADIIAAIVFAALRDGLCVADVSESYVLFSG